MKKELKIYIKENLIDEKKDKKSINIISLLLSLFPRIKSIYEDECDDIDESSESSKNKQVNKYDNTSISSFIKQKKYYNDFQTLLFKMIDERNLKDSDVYNKVHIDRRLFSKIRNNKNYHPCKETIILLGFALELNEQEIVRFLDSASYSLPKNNYYDLIIRFCFINKIYKIKQVNELLEEYSCKLFHY